MLRQIIRDGMIQRYEFSIELLWKFVRIFLKDTMNLSVEKHGPNPTFTAAREVNFISFDEFDTLSELIFDRNETSHTYFEPTAIAIAERIPAHYQVMKKIFDRIKI